jgi:hypothetical protein
MANELTIVPGDVHPVEILERYTAPVGEDLTAGAFCKPNPVGHLMFTNATEDVTGGGFALVSTQQYLPVTLLRRGLIFLGAALDALAFGTRLFLSTIDGRITPTNPAANEVQTIALTGTPTGGTFTLTLNGQTTAGIAFNAAATAVQSALEALSTIGRGNVIVTGSGPWAITFVNDLGKQPIAALTKDATGLTGGTSPNVTVTETVAGVHEIVVGTVEAIPARTTPLKALRVG